MKKVLAISSVLLGVVFLAGCGQQPVSQTQPTAPAPVAQTPTQPVANNQTVPADTSNWKAYSNNTYNFSLKYPANLSVREAPHSKELMKAEIIDESVGHTFFDLSIAKNPQAEVVNTGLGLTVQKLEDTEFLFPEKIEGQISRQETTIGGVEAVKYTYKGLAYSEDEKQNEDAVNVEYEVSNNGYVYSIASFGSDPSYATLLDQIVSTIKFTK